MRTGRSLNLRARADVKGRKPVSPQIMSTVFHELRTPLSSINGYASILLTAELGKLNKEQSEAVEKIRQLCGYLTSLINNLLEISALETATFSILKRNKVDLGKLAGSVIETLSLQAKAKDIDLSLRCGQDLPGVWGSEDDLGRVFINLVSNAIKFTPKAGRIGVEITPQLKENSVLVEVSDTGVGISQQGLNKVFQEFYHEDRPEVGAVGGTGLGLSIVKKIVRAHQGRVWIKSQQGRGTTVSFSVPLVKDEGFFARYFSALKKEAIRTKGRFNLICISVSNCQQILKSGGRKMLEFFLAGAQKAVLPLLRKSDRMFLLQKKGYKLAVIESEKIKSGSVRSALEKELSAYTNNFEPPPAAGRQIVRPHLVVGAAVFPADGGTMSALVEKAKRRAK